MKKEQLDRIFSTYIRMRDADSNGMVQCYCCGKLLPWKQSQNMHYVPRQHMSLRFNEVNCHAGCVKCNYYDNGNIEEYILHLKKDYGNDIAERLAIAKKQAVKYSSAEFKALADYYKSEIKKLEKEKGL